MKKTKTSYFQRRLNMIQSSPTRRTLRDVIWLTSMDWYWDKDVITIDEYHQLIGAAMDRINEIKEEE